MPLYKSSILIILILLLSVSAVLLMHFNNVRAEDEVNDVSYEIAGWIWSDNYGWISLSSNNPQIIDDSLAQGAEYGLELNSDGNKISGWAWSEHVGWICFGSTCSASGCGSITPPLGDDLIAEINGDKSITGWAMVVSMCDQGWIKLGLGDPVDSQAGVDCYDCKDVEITIGEATSTEYQCQTCFTTTKADGQNIPNPSIESAEGGSGNICFGCRDSSGRCQLKEYPISTDLYRIQCDTCNNCFQYGTAQASDGEGMVGWAWNGNSDPYESDGAGWVNFSGRAGIVYPWLETIYGSIYTSGNIRQQSFFDHYNATYCLLAQNVFNFNSDKCEQNYNQFSLSFPQAGQSELGLLDVEGLSTVVKNVDGTNYNKYGNIIVSSSESVINKPIVLKNQVYVFNNGLTINSGFKIDNGGSVEKGNGIVIVNGDLNINSSFDYGNFASSLTLEQTASVAWVVKGDVKIGEGVEKIVGAFIVLGKDGAGCQYEDGSDCNGADYPKYEDNGYGVFFSGKYNQPLTVLGLIVAKAFDFRRTYTSLLQGSERVIYDGRLLVNPPPGLKGFLENLPVIRD